MMNQFVRRDDYRDTLAEIREILGRIWDQLNQKEDKR